MEDLINKTFETIVTGGIGLIFLGITTIIKMLYKQSKTNTKVEDFIETQNKFNVSIVSDMNNIKEQLNESGRKTDDINLRLVALETSHKQNH